MKFKLRARLTAEFLGTAFLVAAVIGSGTMGERLAGGNVAIAMLANTIATGAALVAFDPDIWANFRCPFESSCNACGCIGACNFLARSLCLRDGTMRGSSKWGSHHSFDVWVQMVFVLLAPSTWMDVST